jgi:hypothetical protein
MSLLLLPVPRTGRRAGDDRPEEHRAPVPSGLPVARWWGSVARHVPASADVRSAAAAFLSQVAVVFGLMLAYHYARALADGKTSVALAHSDEVWHLERVLRLPNELSLQHWLLHHPTVAHVADSYYMIHFPLTGIALVWVYLRARPIYRQMRDTLFLLTAAGLVLAFVYPLAPPRMRGDLGFTDVAASFGQSVYGPVGSGSANQFAAMPSLHVGWAVLVGLALVAAGRTRWRWFWLLHPVITVAVVVGTANHYWADGIVAAVLLALAAAVAWGRASRRQQRLRSVLPGQRTGNHSFAGAPSPESTAQVSSP